MRSVALTATEDLVIARIMDREDRTEEDVMLRALRLYDALSEAHAKGKKLYLRKGTVFGKEEHVLWE